jgi:chemotaxis protein histidine kinase CheA
MAARANDSPLVQTFADHEVIVPPHRLKKAVVAVPAGWEFDDPIARAEEALAGLADEFTGWIESECKRLDVARRTFRSAGASEAVCGDLFRAAHDIRGDAATFGFPIAGSIAESLCRLIEHTPEREQVPVLLVDQHVDAIRAIVRVGESEGASETAHALLRRLRDVTEEFLAHANRHRPHYLVGFTRA